MDDTSSRRGLQDALSLGYNLVAGMAICAGLGYWVGRKTGHLRLGVLLGSLAGLACMIHEIRRVIRRLQGADPPGKPVAPPDQREPPYGA